MIPNALKKLEELKEVSGSIFYNVKTSGSLWLPKNNIKEREQSYNVSIRNGTQVHPPSTMHCTQ